MTPPEEQRAGRPPATGRAGTGRAGTGWAGTGRRSLQVVLAVLAVGAGALLVAVDADRRLFWAGAHAPISATPLFAVAALLVVSSPAARFPDLLEGAVGVVAFVAWGLYQLFPGFRYGDDLNDLAILGFVADVLLVVAGRARRGGPGPRAGPGRARGRVGGGAGAAGNAPEEAPG